MKLYTLEFNCNTPTTQQVNVPTNTDFKVGIKVTKNGEVLDIAPAEMTLGGTAADATKTNGYITFTMASGDDAKYDSKVVAIEMQDGFQTTFTLNINVYKSQQGDIGVAGSGGGVTEQWVEDYVAAETSAFITEVPENLSVETLDVKNDSYTVITAGTDSNENDSGVLNVKGTYGKLRVGGDNDINAVRINANGTTPNIQVGKMGTSDSAAAALSCDSQGHGLLVLDSMPFGASRLSAYVTTSAMESYVDAQIGNVLSTNF